MTTLPSVHRCIEGCVPPAGDLRRIREIMVRRYGEQRDWLRMSGAALLGRETAARPLSVPESRDVEREIEGYVYRCETSAVIGLAVVGAGASAAELERIASDGKSPTRVVAGDALRRIRTRSR